MTITVEMAKTVASHINKDELKRVCIKDVKNACFKFDIESVDFDNCEDSYDYERKVEEEYEEFVREVCAEEDSVVDYLYFVIEEIYPEKIDLINLDWLELNAITKEILFENKEGKSYNYEEFRDMVFELGDEGWIILDDYEIYKTYNDYEEDQKSYGKDNGSGWSPNW